MSVAVLNLPAASAVLVNNGGCLVFHATRETSGSASAVYKFWDGTNNQGTLLLPTSLQAAQSTRDNFTPHMMPFHTGLYFELVSGVVEGDVSVLTGHDCGQMLMEILHG
jgi:hypothetical protein